MKKSTLLLVSLAFLMVMAALTFSASAVCSSCMQEGDWSQSATSFIEGKPISDTPQDFGPRAVRQTTSQFENTSKTAQENPSNAENTAATGTVAADTSVPKVAVNLLSINASPSSTISGSPVKITAVFAVAGQEQSESQTGIADNTSATQSGESLLTASATVKDSTGRDIGNVNLIKTSGNEYSGIWGASVPAGAYNVNIFASSMQGSGNFNNALQINVLASADAPAGKPAVRNLG